MLGKHTSRLEASLTAKVVRVQDTLAIFQIFCTVRKNGGCFIFNKRIFSLVHNVHQQF